MRLLKLSVAYLRQARPRFEDAKDALEEGNHAYAVRLSQECVELSLKAVLRAVAIDYPKVHDVSDVLVAVKDRLPRWFQAKLDFLAESSKVLVKKRELSFYGGEEEFLSPEDVISEADARDAVSRAGKTLELCEKLLNQLRGCQQSLGRPMRVGSGSTRCAFRHPRFRSRFSTSH